jgi:DNA-directed RNA polymerase specialized sigma24 family protein
MIPFEGVFLLRNEVEVQAFYERWGASVLRFCRLFFGDETVAQKAAIEVFLIYLRAEHSLDQDRMPTTLLRTAVKVVRDRCMAKYARNPEDQSLPSAILALPCEQRTIFILRYVLQLDTATVASAAGVFEEDVRKMSFQALLKVRELLPRNLLKELT